MRRWGLAGLTAALALAAVAAGAAGPDAANGARLAKRWCAECHVVAPGQAQASADVPAFSAIAADPAKTVELLTTVLTVPEKAHTRMQNLNLSRVEIADLIAYIKTQKP